MSVRGLTVRQPWADAIAYAGKTVENRGWAPATYRGRLLIHSAAKADSVAGVPADLPGVRGAVIATATLASVHEGRTCSCSRWAEPRAWHWVLTNVCLLRTPVPCAGARGLWLPSQDVLDRVRAVAS